MKGKNSLTLVAVQVFAAVLVLLLLAVAAVVFIEWKKQKKAAVS